MRRLAPYEVTDFLFDPSGSNRIPHQFWPSQLTMPQNILHELCDGETPSIAGITDILTRDQKLVKEKDYFGKTPLICKLFMPLSTH